MANVDNGFWVFGYGSLVWQPEFEFTGRHIARLEGYVRSFCMWSFHYRGTEEYPGLVLALDKQVGAGCDGVAFFVPPETAVQTIAKLRKRELISAAYLEEIHTIELRDGRRVDSLTYVIDPNHVQYCDGLSLERQAQVIATAVGGRGPNSEYLYNTARHLAKIGIRDPNLDWLADRVRSLTKTSR